MENVSKEMLERSDEMISKMTADEIRALFEENDKLRQELRIRDNDILSHDQVFDSIVRGTYHVILVMSVTTFKAEFITTNIDAALGIDRAEAIEDVRVIGHSFENIEDHNGREEIFIHRTNAVVAWCKILWNVDFQCVGVGGVFNFLQCKHAVVLVEQGSACCISHFPAGHGFQSEAHFSFVSVPPHVS